MLSTRDRTQKKASVLCIDGSDVLEDTVQSSRRLDTHVWARLPWEHIFHPHNWWWFPNLYSSWISGRRLGRRMREARRPGGRDSEGKIAEPGGAQLQLMSRPRPLLLLLCQLLDTLLSSPSPQASSILGLPCCRLGSGLDYTPPPPATHKHGSWDDSF